MIRGKQTGEFDGRSTNDPLSLLESLFAEEGVWLFPPPPKFQIGFVR